MCRILFLCLIFLTSLGCNSPAIENNISEDIQLICEESDLDSYDLDLHTNREESFIERYRENFETDDYLEIKTIDDYVLINILAEASCLTSYIDATSYISDEMQGLFESSRYGSRSREILSELGNSNWQYNNKANEFLYQMKNSGDSIPGIRGTGIPGEFRNSGDSGIPGTVYLIAYPAPMP